MRMPSPAVMWSMTMPFSMLSMLSIGSPPLFMVQHPGGQPQQGQYQRHADEHTAPGLLKVKLEKERFLEAEEDQTIQQTQELIEALDAGPDFLDAFDGELFRELVDKIIVESNDRLRFRLVNGLELAEPIERTVR